MIQRGLQETYPSQLELERNTYLYSKVLDTDDLKVLKTLRTSAHGITVDSLCVVVSKQQAIKCVTKLHDLDFIKQDSRSVNQGYDLTDDEAIIYTKKEYRGIIDHILLVKGI